LNKMIDRVASAISALDTNIVANDYEAMARAVIAAMREPTEAMIDAAPDEAVGWSEIARRHAADYWRAMVDAALAED
jgi:hypothetical protein